MRSTIDKDRYSFNGTQAQFPFERKSADFDFEKSIMQRRPIFHHTNQLAVYPNTFPGKNILFNPFRRCVSYLNLTLLLLQNERDELAEKDFVNLTITQNVNQIQQEDAIEILRETANALENHWQFQNNNS